MTQKEGSVRRKLFLAIFAPSLLVSLLTGGVGMWVGLQGVRRSLEGEAQMQADVLAGASRRALSINDDISLDELLRTRLGEGNVQRVVIYSASGQIVSQLDRRSKSGSAPGAGDTSRTYIARRKIKVGDEVIIGELMVEVSMESYYESRHWYIVGGLASLAILTLVAAVVAGLLRQRLLKPLDDLTNTARAISTDNDYSVRVKQINDLEFQPLTNAFNQMLGEIEKQTEALHSANSDLRRANKELEAFTYSVSHDLRTPLRAISSFAQILNQSDEPLSTECKESLRVIQRNAAKMAQLIDDLLAFSKIDTHPLERQDVDLTRIAREAWNEVVSGAGKRTVEFSVEEMGRISADPALVHQVFVNLLDNALKYSRGRDRSEISVRRVEKENQSMYLVRDNGVGFDMKYASKLFRVFERLHTDREFEGTGVGLALVRRIVERHGGRIWAEAEMNRGATFYFSLGT